MCTRYIAAPSVTEIARLFDARWTGGDVALPEMFPGRGGAVVGRSADGGLGVSLMRWGFPPPAGVKAPVVNVRNTASPFWRSALSHPARRCLVPVARFCEWGSNADGRKVAHWFTLPDRPLFAFAGIWRKLTEADAVPGKTGDETGGTAGKAAGGERFAFAFLTCAPNPLVGAVHPKAMPVILHADDHARWLDAPMAEALSLVEPYPSQLMAMDAAVDDLRTG